MEGVQSEGGALNRTTIVRLAENLILRSRKRLNSNCSEASIQGIPSGYGFHTQHLVVLLFLILTHSQDREERRKGNGCGQQNGGRRADGWAPLCARPERY